MTTDLQRIAAVGSFFCRRVPFPDVANIPDPFRHSSRNMEEEEEEEGKHEKMW